MENTYWKKSVGTLIGAIWLYTLADIAGSVTRFVNGLSDPGGIMGMIASLTGDNGGFSFGVGDLLEYLFPVLVLFGYYLFYTSLTRFMRMQRSDADREAVGKVRKAYILMVIAVLVGYLWLPGKLAALILTIVGYVRLLSGYRSLKRSATFPEEARRGAGRLFGATVWLLVGYLLGCIPLVGGAIESVISFILFFFVLSGWGRIRNGAPELTEAEAAEQAAAEAAVVKRSVVPAWWFPAFVGVFLLVGMIGFSLHIGWIEDALFSFGHPYFGTVFFPVTETLSQIAGQLFIIGFCCYLLGSKRVALSSLSRIGLAVMVVMAGLGLLTVYLPYAIAIDWGMPLQEYANLHLWVLISRDVLFVAGALLFVWSTAVNRTVKIGWTVYEVLALAGIPLLLVFHTWAMQRYAHDPDPAAVQNFTNLLNQSYLLAVNALSFVVLSIGTICRQRNRSAEAAAAE